MDELIASYCTDTHMHNTLFQLNTNKLSSISTYNSEWKPHYTILSLTTSIYILCTYCAISATTTYYIDCICSYTWHCTIIVMVTGL